MMNKTKLALTVSALALTAGMFGVAAARDDRGGPPHPRELEGKYDKNGDGKLDETERAALHADMKARRAEHHAKVLAQFDKNRDGKLDDAERDQMMDQKVTEHFKKLDADGNGAVTLQELKAGMKQRHKHVFLGHPGHPGGPGGPGGFGRFGGPPPGAGPDMMIHVFDGDELE